VMTAQTLYAELGPDLGAAFPSEDHFASWLMLAPKKDVSGGKVIRHYSIHSRNRVRRHCVWRRSRSMTATAISEPAIVPCGDDSDVESKR
jgi:transposase